MKSLFRELNGLINHFPIKNKEATSLLIQLPPENSLEAQLILIKNLTGRGFKFVILSGGRPCHDLINTFKYKNINLENIYIIDMICRSHNLDVKNQKMVTHLEGMQELTKISIIIGNMVIPKKTILFIDSITSMLLYNNEAIFTKFINDILKKMRIRGVHLILLITKGKNYDNLRDELTSSPTLKGGDSLHVGQYLWRDESRDSLHTLLLFLE
ncbi:MAG TPA: hypothetical protein VJI98_05760 [Candidatus Nanoarchaeia archaeon]|nr:hypothetical protein [Candidatus Nanoarchaeia archaeon]